MAIILSMSSTSSQPDTTSAMGVQMLYHQLGLLPFFLIKICWPPSSPLKNSFTVFKYFVLLIQKRLGPVGAGGKIGG